MRIAGSEKALVVCGLLGMLAAAFIWTYGDEGADEYIPASTRPSSIDSDPGKGRASLNVAAGGDSLEFTRESIDSQARTMKGVADRRDGSSAEETDPSTHWEANREIHENARLTEAGLFRPSRSIEEQCRTRPVPTEDSCTEVSSLLEEMSREGRDVEWATRAESRIRAVISARGNEMQIRALECRVSLCAIETVTPGDVHLGFLDQSEQESAGVMDDGDWVLAWENDPALGRMTVTARIYSRRVK